MRSTVILWNFGISSPASRFTFAPSIYQLKMALNIGTKAPDFTLATQSGTLFNLYNTLETGKSVVLFFYPKDFTGGCTAEVCEFRDSYADFVSADTEVVGISADSVSSHSRFAAQHQLQFPILADIDEKVATLYDTGKVLLLLKNRITYIINTKGIITDCIVNNLNPTAHINASLESLKLAAKK
jgi:peroxiredoxin Q/BCP